MSQHCRPGSGAIFVLFYFIDTSCRKLFIKKLWRVILKKNNTILAKILYYELNSFETNYKLTLKMKIKAIKDDK